MNLMNDEKHYNTFNNYLKNRFNHKVFKVSLNANMTCPNRDGAKGFGGCIYCSDALSGDFAGKVSDDFKTQFNQVLNDELKKWPNATYIAYLQAGSNTYNPVSKLKEIYEEILSLNENIEVLSIATRPDCITKEIVDLLEEINFKKEVWVELGLQTINLQTSIFINKCYDNTDFEKAMDLLTKANIKVIVHIINGLPYDSNQDMLDIIDYLNHFKIFGLKIHMLHVLKNTELEKIYLKEPFHLLSLDEYADIVVRQLRLLNPDVIIHRITGDGKKEDLIAPLWTLKKFVVLNEIDKKMRKEKVYQGDLYENN